MEDYYESFFEEIKKSDEKHSILPVLYTTKKNGKFTFSNILFIDVNQKEESVKNLEQTAKRMDFVFFNQDSYGKPWIQKHLGIYIKEIFGKLENEF